MEMKLEVLVVPVSDVDRAKGFYESLGFRLDANFVTGSDFRGRASQPTRFGVLDDHLRQGAHDRTAGSLQGMHLVVDDIEKAHTELANIGVAVSEVFHDEGGIFHHAGTEARICRARPERRSYGSFASFSDPDGNGWLIQEVVHRAPGR